MFFYNFCYDFLGQRYCCAKTSIIGYDFLFLQDSIAHSSFTVPLPHSCSGVPGGNVANLQLRFGSPLRNPFFDLSPPLFAF